MAFLYKREQDENELTYEVRAFLSAIGGGKSEAEAAAHACIDEEDLRRWKRDPVFRAAVKQARRKGPREAHMYFMNDPAPSSSPFPAPGTSDARVDAEGWRRLR